MDGIEAKGRLWGRLYEQSSFYESDGSEGRRGTCAGARGAGTARAPRPCAPARFRACTGPWPAARAPRARFSALEPNSSIAGTRREALSPLRVCALCNRRSVVADASQIAAHATAALEAATHGMAVFQTAS